MFEGLEFSPTARARVRVPASTSNLGPGFDLLGLALSLWLEVELAPARGTADDPLELGDGFEREWPRGPGNRLLRGFELGRIASAGSARPLGFRVRSQIPVSRGLGSSAAAIAAGLLLGAASGPRPVPRERLIELATELEGHPDNVAPALLGGCVLSVPRAGQAPCCVRQALHPSLAFAVAWPDARMETAFARGLLPARVALADAVENTRRLALLLEGLRSGRRELLGLGAEDRLHVPYRLPHIPCGPSALAAARAAGAWLATISGSGTALFLIAAHADIAGVAEAARIELEHAAPPAVAHVVSVADQAPFPVLT